MQVETRYQQTFATLFLRLDAEETVTAEAGAMVAMTDGMQIRTHLAGSVFRALLRRILGGESMFVNEYRHPSGGEIVLAPSLPGAITKVRVSAGRDCIVQAGAFVASTGSVSVKPQWMGLRGMFAGGGPFLLRLSGEGEVWIGSYGGLFAIEVDGAHTVDTGHVVAFDPGLDFRLRGMGSWKSTLFSGEGLVLEFTGKGRVLCQTRHLRALAGWITPMLPA